MHSTEQDLLVPTVVHLFFRQNGSAVDLVSEDQIQQFGLKIGRRDDSQIHENPPSWLAQSLFEKVDGLARDSEIVRKSLTGLTTAFAERGDQFGEFGK